MIEVNNPECDIQYVLYKVFIEEYLASWTYIICFTRLLFKSKELIGFQFDVIVVFHELFLSGEVKYDVA